MPTSDYELYDRIEDILEEDGKVTTNTIIWENGTVLPVIKQTVIFVAHMDWEIETKEVNC
jgi:hypothetical protein